MIDVISKPNTTVKNKTGSWRVFKPEINFEKCIACGTCSKICPENCIKMTRNNNKLRPKTDYDYCKGCGLCAVECSVNAIKMGLDEK